MDNVMQVHTYNVKWVHRNIDAMERIVMPMPTEELFYLASSVEEDA